MKRGLAFKQYQEVIRLSAIPRVIQRTNASSSRMLRGCSVKRGDAVVLLSDGGNCVRCLPSAQGRTAASSILRFFIVVVVIEQSLSVPVMELKELHRFQTII